MASNLRELRTRVEELGDILDIPALRLRAEELEREMTRPDFWDDPESAKGVSSEFSRAEERVRSYEDLSSRIADAEELLELAEEDAALAEEVGAESKAIESELEVLEVERLFAGEYDDNPAILAINPGAGGVDSQDWAEMLSRMYSRWAERHGYRLETIEYTVGEEAGVKSATFTISGEHAFGLLSAERGVHRLVRISPYDSSGRRHTSFASVTVAPLVDDAVEVEVDEKDLKIDTYRASGAGGQHVNKTDSAVRITHLPSGIVVQCQNERSQHQNREVAMGILRARLFDLEREKRAEEVEAQSGEKSDIGWGQQIRSYVLHPEKRIKDLRTGEQTSDVDRFLDGDLDEFIYSYLKTRAAG